MKRFAVILIIAVLALGCVFAASTGDDSTNKVAGLNATSGDKIYVTTTIDRVYPVYQIIAYTGTSETSGVTSASSESSANTITGEKTTNASTGDETVTVKVAIQHYGLEGNDASATKKTNIRYNGSVKVTVTATALVNQNSEAIEQTTANTADSKGHVWMSALPTATSFADKNTLTTYCTVTPATASENSASVTAKYSNGTVLTGVDAKTIANDCTFTWTTTNLTAGDSYEANITVTYETV